MLVRPLLLRQKRRRHANTLADRHQQTKTWHGAMREDTGNTPRARKLWREREKTDRKELWATNIHMSGKKDANTINCTLNRRK
jgi:hypothetical protein